MFLMPDAIPGVILSVVLRLLAGVGIATCLLVVADVFWTKKQWRKGLRMSRQEIKDEMKQMQGDPLVRSRLRSIALDRARKNMIAAVPRATLVIANPTHYAIALRYVREEGGAPTVLAKGQDLIALEDPRNRGKPRHSGDRRQGSRKVHVRPCSSRSGDPARLLPCRG